MLPSLAKLHEFEVWTLKIQNKTSIFSDIVVEWFNCNGRIYPWRQTTNPYNIFVAEVLLRKTQAQRVVDTHLKILSKYPTFEALAQADIRELVKWFQPLGLFKRAKLLVKSSEYVVTNFKGILPRRLDILMSVPGLGVYSARAVACLAFNARVPMIDESTGRLLRRVLRLDSKRPAYCDKTLIKITQNLVPKENSRNFNLGLRDIAAKYCRPKNPRCIGCPIKALCLYCTQ
jgi:A/G-specific adenine glycosylase